MPGLKILAMPSLSVAVVVMEHHVTVSHAKLPDVNICQETVLLRIAPSGGCMTNHDRRLQSKLNMLRKWNCQAWKPACKGRPTVKHCLLPNTALVVAKCEALLFAENCPVMHHCKFGMTVYCKAKQAYGHYFCSNLRTFKMGNCSGFPIRIISHNCREIPRQRICTNEQK